MKPPGVTATMRTCPVDEHERRLDDLVAIESDFSEHPMTVISLRILCMFILKCSKKIFFLQSKDRIGHETTLSDEIYK